jgi:hypothetical protein
MDKKPRLGSDPLEWIRDNLKDVFQHRKPNGGKLTRRRESGLSQRERDRGYCR